MGPESVTVTCGESPPCSLSQSRLHHHSQAFTYQHPSPSPCHISLAVPCPLPIPQHLSTMSHMCCHCSHFTVLTINLSKAQPCSHSQLSFSSFPQTTLASEMMNFSKFLQSFIYWEHGRIWDCVCLEYPLLHLLLPPLHGGHPAPDKSKFFPLSESNSLLHAMKLHSLTVPSLWIMNMPFLTRHFRISNTSFFSKSPWPHIIPYYTNYCPISSFPFTSEILIYM